MGKDSVAMLLVILNNPSQYPLNEIVFYDTGMEFEETYKIAHKVKKLARQNHIKYTVLKPKTPFIDKMINYPHLSRKGEMKKGYGWCGGLCRWGTTEKIRTLDNYCKDAIQYIGIAYDEKERFQRLTPNKKSPLYDLRLTENDCKHICESHDLLNPLYKYLYRVSCWCCRNKNLSELKEYYENLPEYFDKLCKLEEKIGVPMKPPYTLIERFIK